MHKILSSDGKHKQFFSTNQFALSSTNNISFPFLCFPLHLFGSNDWLFSFLIGFLQSFIAFDLLIRSNKQFYIILKLYRYVVLFELMTRNCMIMIQWARETQLCQQKTTNLPVIVFLFFFSLEDFDHKNDERQYKRKVLINFLSYFVFDNNNKICWILAN